MLQIHAILALGGRRWEDEKDKDKEEIQRDGDREVKR